MAVSRTRSRTSILMPSGEFGRAYNYNCSLSGVRLNLLSSSSYTTSTSRISEAAICVDEVQHAPLRIKRPKKSKGGPLDLRKVRQEGGVSKTLTIRRNCYTDYVGKFYLQNLPTGYTTPFDDWREDVAAEGPAGWNKFRPGRPEVSMGVFVGELRDFPGMLKQACRALLAPWRIIRRTGPNPLGRGLASVASRGGKTAAEAFLAYVFGWAPFVRDLQRCYQTSVQIDRILNEIIQNNGKVRRRGGWLKRNDNTQILSDSQTWSSCSPVLGTSFYSCQPRLRVVQRDETLIWFRGAFRYYIDPKKFGSKWWNFNTKRLIYGLTLNAETAWNLLPWSWMADWFANIGDNIASLDNGWADMLTAKYAYVMGTRRRTITQDAFVNFVDGQSLRLHGETIYESKQRVHASPYGFGVSFDSFNPMRLAILGALGMSRTSIRSMF